MLKILASQDRILIGTNKIALNPMSGSCVIKSLITQTIMICLCNQGIILHI